MSFKENIETKKEKIFLKGTNNLMKRLLTILTIIAVMFTFSFGSAFAGTFANASVGQAVNSTISAVDFTKYLVADEGTINDAKATLIKATEKEETYNATVVEAINTFKNAIAAIKTIDEQKAELTKVKTNALTTVDNEILALNVDLTNALTEANTDEAKQRLTTLSADIVMYKEYLKDKINAIVIVDNRTNFTTPEVDLEKATNEVNIALNSIKTMEADAFYDLRDKLNKRDTLYLAADNYAKTLALAFKADEKTRMYSDKAIADVLAEAKAQIKILELENKTDIADYMTTYIVPVDTENDINFDAYKTSAITSITTGAYALTGYSGANKVAVENIQKTYSDYIKNANSKTLIDAYVAQAKSAMSAYKTDAQIVEDNKKLDENKELKDKLAKMELDKKITNFVNVQTDNLKCTSKKTKAGNIKVFVKNFDTAEIVKEGYAVKYTYYRAAKKASGFKAMKTKDTTTYINTTGKKGTKYFYKVKVLVYDKDGNLVVATKLSDCASAYRTK